MTTTATVKGEYQFFELPDVDDVVKDYYDLQEARLRALIMEAKAIEKSLIRVGKRNRSVFRVKQ